MNFENSTWKKVKVLVLDLLLTIVIYGSCFWKQNGHHFMLLETIFNKLGEIVKL